MRAIAPAEKFKYATFIEAMPDMRRAFIIDGLTPREIYKKFAPVTRKGFGEQILKNYIHVNGWVVQRTRLAEARANMVKAKNLPPEKAKALIERTEGKVKTYVERNHGGAVAAAIVDTVIEREKAGQMKHFDRMERMTDKVAEVLEKKSDNLTPKNLGEHLVQLGQFDSLARKLYHMDDRQPVNMHQFNIAVLTQVEDIPQAMVLAAPED